MRKIAAAIVLCTVVFAIAPASAQTAITIIANPIPIVDAQINDRAVRLEVDLRMPDSLILSTAAADRLGVRRLPFVAVTVGAGGNGRIRGRVARPQLVFSNRASRAFAGVFAVPVTDRADGVIGPGALPYDDITIVLGDGSSRSTRDIVFSVEDADDWKTQAELAGATMGVRFNLATDASVFNHAAAALLDPLGRLRADGELREVPVTLGLRALAQPVQTDLTVQGLPLAPALASTNAPLKGALDEDTIIVRARDDDAPRPGVTIGRAALARCSSMTMNRRARTITLRCAN